MSPGDAIRVECPCCHAMLTIDRELGEVLAHDPPPRAGVTRDLGSAFDALRTKSAEREERFRKQLSAEAQKGKVLDRKFQEGLKRAKDSPDPPARPFDFD